ncbi:MAG TPA: hypothetical protein VLC48_08770 [Gemmatimonadota bacterium]|nr:hypothetical protein [Gemmatimonadota bacterium]
MKIRLLIVSIAVSVVGCAGEVEERPLTAVRDSAGIAIVESYGASWGEAEAWRLAEEPAVRIGQVEGEIEYLLMGAYSALRFSDGTIAVSNTGTEEIRFFDAEGRYLRSAGGRGGGPGEFEQLVWIYPFGEDSIVAYDDRPPAVKVFHRDGRFGRSLRPEVLGLLRGAFADGSLLFEGSGDWSKSRMDGRVRPPTRAFRLDPRGELLDSLSTFPGREFDRRTRGGSIGLAPPPFGRETVFAVAGDGFFAGSQDDFELGYYDLHGRLQTIIRWPPHERGVTPEQIEAYRRYELDGIENENLRHRVVESLDQQVYPEMLPAFGPIKFDGTGNLWVQEYHSRWEDTQSWIVFDAQGRMRGRVVMPGDIIVHQVGDDFVLGYTWDEMDVEYIELYELIKPLPTEATQANG